MENTALLFSILYFSFFIIYISLGLYVILSDPKEPVNRVLFAMLVALSIWTFGFTIAISASDYASYLFLRRISAMGWGIYFGILVHWALIFTQKKELLKKWWIYVVIYLPAAIIVFTFSMSGSLVPNLYNLVDTQWGWFNRSQNTGWDICYAIYNVVYSFISMMLVFLWGRQSKDPIIKKQVRLILSMFLLVIVLAILTDILCGAFLKISAPEMAPIFMVAIIYAIYYSNHQGGFIRMPVKNKESIFNVISIKKVYLYLSIATILGGVLNFAIRDLLSKETGIANVLILSLTLIVFGVLIQVVQRLNISEQHKDLISVGLLAILIPMVALQFTKTGSVTVWAFPFIFILAFLVFNERMLLVIMSASIIFTQILVWIITPEAYVKVNGFDYLGRIGLFCIAICLCYYINKLFLIRLNETADKMKLQELITQISSDCVGINQQNIEENIGYLLKKSSDFFSVDRTYICLFDHDENTFSCIQDYCRLGIESGKARIQKIPINRTHWRMEKILGNEMFIASDITKLPVFVNSEFDDLKNHQIKSQIIAPITSKEKVIGFWGFDSEKKIIEWQDDHQNYVKIIANILGDTLTRIDAEKELNFLAHYDEVTKLPNRNLFTNYVFFNIVKQEFSKKLLGVIFLDLDSFKTVNDTVGHGMGDELLYMVGEKLRGVIKKSDIVSRFSGDEFLIMINNQESEEEVIQIAKRIMDLFYEPFILKGQEFFMTASAGIALYPTDGEDAETLIMNADIAKFKAKEKGRNQYVLCSDNIKSEISKKMLLTNYLYRAQEHGELYVEYQPQVSLHTGKVTGVESLLRWRHPELGIISPGVIIPLAEQTSLINPIGEWVLETACRQNKEWQDMGIAPILMAVNISASQFKNPHFISQVEAILKKTGLKPEYLEMEITESTAILEFNEIISKLNGLKEIGVSIAIDDFGTEYSSLGRIKMLPLDRIKMDKQFVDGIGQNHKDQAIANAIIQLGKSLGLSVVAEGVEYEDQIAFLKTSECDLIQGYYYYKPLNATAVENILRKQG